MREDFLHYIWRYQKFNIPSAKTVTGLPVQIIKPGFGHTNAGPDFLQAKVKIGDVEWAGAVEIHIKASDWNRHRHQNDAAYQNVILHVVWTADEAILHPDGTEIPTLELKNCVNLNLLNSYKNLVESNNEIACASQWPEVDSMYKTEMLERVLVERLNEKAEKASVFFEHSGQNWEEVSYFMLLSAMGFKVNQHPFERLATILPYSLIKKIKHHPALLEAALFGAAGFLTQDFEEEYPNQLKKDWQFLQHKHHQMLSTTMELHEWRFLRLRPANFPTIRIAQLAALLHKLPFLFDAFVLDLDPKKLQNEFKVTPNHYWEKHFQFDKPTQTKNKQPGQSSIQLLLLNTIPPLLAFYAKSIGEEKYIEQAIQFLGTLKSENNFITRKFQDLGSTIRTSFDSQAYIQLHNAHCNPKKCLSCSVGISIMK